MVFSWVTMLVPGDVGVGAELDGERRSTRAMPDRPDLTEPAAAEAPFEHPHFEIRKGLTGREEGARHRALGVGGRLGACALLVLWEFDRFAHCGYRAMIGLEYHNGTGMGTGCRAQMGANRSTDLVRTSR